MKCVMGRSSLWLSGYFALPRVSLVICFTDEREVAQFQKMDRSPDSSDGLFKIHAPVFSRPVTIIPRCVDRDQKREWPRYAVTQNPRPADYETGWSVAG